MGRLTGKVALITGAGRKRGLGEAIARHFAEEGAHVMLSDVGRTPVSFVPEGNIGTPSEMEEVASLIRSHLHGKPGVGEVETCICDVLQEEDARRAVSLCLERFGRIDILVNNAGIGFISKPILELSVEEWDLVLDVNLRGAFLMTKYAAAQMISQIESGVASSGRIINIASRGAKSGSPNYSAYASSKHGMIGLTRVAAVEFGKHNITVNAVCPNHVTTGLGAAQNILRSRLENSDLDAVMEMRKSRIPLGRIGVADDTANACLFLASDEASFITGEAMNVSGGEEMH